MARRSPASLIWQLLFAIPFKLACLGLMILIPVLGVWVASSMAVFSNRSVLLPVGAGLLMFPVLPLLWEVYASWRRERKRRTGPQYTTRIDRLFLRTIGLSGLLIAGLLWAYPRQAFTALSSNGDWFLGGGKGPRIERARCLIFRAADRLEWLYQRSRSNPYKQQEQRGGKPAPIPAPSGVRPTPGTQPDQRPPSTSQPAARRPVDESPSPPAWPQPAELHPLVQELTADQETSPEAVARHFRDRTPGDLWQRARAIHDYVASRVAYDVAALRSGNFPPQDAQTVFRTHQSVCAGYANLFKAMADAADLEAAFVVGDARNGADEDKEKPVDGLSHAWNGVKLDDRWYLVDVTWDAGHVAERFRRDFRTHYFLTPPEVFGMTHFPEDSAWQLRERPMTRGEFIRQPMLRPGFFAAGLSLRSPDRAQVNVARELRIELDNPRRRFLLVAYQRPGDGPRTECQLEGGSVAIASCRFAEAGRYDVQLCTSTQQYGRYSCEGTIRVNASF